MYLVNTFSFSEPYEINQLLVKLNTEDPGVDEWIITENSYTQQGEYKGPNKLKNIIENDIRFKKFLHKISVFDMDFAPTVTPPAEDKAMENAQREVSRNYILEKYPIDDTWLITSDTDEVLDFTNPNTLDIIMDSFKNCGKQIVRPNHVCLAYDYDNVTIGYSWSRPTMAKLELVANSGITFGKIRDISATAGFSLYPNLTGFHYYYCFEPRFILRKIRTYIHRTFKKETFNEALYYNLGCEKLELDETNSPVYVRDNINWLRTNSVPVDYKENRIKRDNGDNYVPDLIGQDEKGGF